MDILLVFGVLFGASMFLLVVVPFVVEDSIAPVAMLLLFPFGLLHFVVGLGFTFRGGGRVNKLYYMQLGVM